MNNLDKQYTDLVNDAYMNYLKQYEKGNRVGIVNYSDPLQYIPYSNEEFINKIKTDDEFAEKWGFQVYTRELSYDERFRITYKDLELRKALDAESKMLHYPDGHNKVMEDANIPTRAISLTYNNQTIEIYE